MDCLLSDTKRSPESNRDIAEAVLLYAGIKDVLIPDCAAQFEVLSTSVQVSRSAGAAPSPGQQALSLALSGGFNKAVLGLNAATCALLLLGQYW